MSFKWILSFSLFDLFIFLSSFLATYTLHICPLSSPILLSLLSLRLSVSCFPVSYLLIGNFSFFPSSYLTFLLLFHTFSSLFSFFFFKLCPISPSISCHSSPLIHFFHPSISSLLSPQFSCMIWAPRLTHSPALQAAWPPIAAVSTWAIRPAATGVAVTASGAPSAASVCPVTQDTSVKRVSQTFFGLVH